MYYICPPISEENYLTGQKLNSSCGRQRRVTVSSQPPETTMMCCNPRYMSPYYLSHKKICCILIDPPTPACPKRSSRPKGTVTCCTTYNRHYSFLYIDSSLPVRTVRGGLHPAMLLTYTWKSPQAWQRCHVNKTCFWFAAEIPWLAERLSDSERRVTKSVSSIPIIEFIFENFPQFATQDTG
jgi:hypothetical protein